MGVLLQLDVKRYKCAIVLCDALWLDPDADDLNGIETKEKRDFLRLDAMIMMVQLNVRKVRFLPAATCATLSVSAIHMLTSRTRALLCPQTGAAVVCFQCLVRDVTDPSIPVFIAVVHAHVFMINQLAIPALSRWFALELSRACRALER